MADIIERLRFDAARCEATFSKGVATNIEEGASEIEALRRFLQIALDEHDDHFGVTNAEKYPKNWDVQARKRLDPVNQQQARPTGTPCRNTPCKYPKCDCAQRIDSTYSDREGNIRREGDGGPDDPRRVR